jgi:hypothetical protein
MLYKYITFIFELISEGNQAPNFKSITWLWTINYLYLGTYVYEKLKPIVEMETKVLLATTNVGWLVGWVYWP